MGVVYVLHVFAEYVGSTPLDVSITFTQRLRADDSMYRTRKKEVRNGTGTYHCPHMPNVSSGGGGQEDRRK